MAQSPGWLMTSLVGPTERSLGTLAGIFVYEFGRIVMKGCFA
jgi:hypothetical protein